MPQFVDIRMPADSQEGTTATLTQWFRKPGDLVAEFEALAELETDKVNVEVPSPASGYLVEQLHHPGEVIAPGALLGRIQVGGAEPVAPAEASPVQVSVASEPGQELEGADERLSPAVRRLLKEHQLDPSHIKGTGKDGRLTKNDILTVLAQPSAPAAVKPTPVAPAQPSHKLSAHPLPGALPSRMVPHSNMRKSIASHMVASLLETAPHVTSLFEMDLGAVIKHRKSQKEVMAQAGINLTMTAYFVLAVVEALKAVPEVNSRWHTDALELFDDMNIGVGTALGDKGLIVPVIHQAQNLGLRGVAAKLGDLTERARLGKLGPSDVKGGTFTISNHGVSGSLMAAPIIINQPQSAILGIGKLQKRVVVVERDGEDTIQIRPMCYVTLSIDHRSLDAYQCNAFLSKFVSTLENWPKE